jgi:hypothetical protein
MLVIFPQRPIQLIRIELSMGGHAFDMVESFSPAWLALLH